MGFAEAFPIRRPEFRAPVIQSAVMSATRIASAAAEQSQGITEVNTAVSQTDQITQKNAVMVEETSAETQP